MFLFAKHSHSSQIAQARLSNGSGAALERVSSMRKVAVTDSNGKWLCDLDVPADDDASVIAPPENSPFQRIVRCRACKQWSFTLNPCKKGQFSPDGKYGHQFRPWAYGTEWNPSGQFCRISDEAFKFGNYAAEHGSLSDMVKKMRVDATLFPQLQDSERRWVVLVNSGVITAHVRGPKKEAVQDELKNGRKEVVKAFERKFLQQRIPMKTYSFEEYKDQFNVKEIPADLQQIKGYLWADGKRRDTVWVRKYKEGEADCDLINEAGTEYKDTVDDGTNVVAGNQVRNAFEMQSRALDATAATAHRALPAQVQPQLEDERDEEPEEPEHQEEPEDDVNPVIAR